MDIQIEKQMKNKAEWKNKTSRTTSYWTVDLQIDIFRDLQLVTDIKRSNQVLHLSTNVGSKINQTKAIVPDYDKVIANILSPANLVRKYRVAYDSHQDYAFAVHAYRGVIRFSRNKQGLYFFKPTYTTENSKFVAPMEENMVGFISIQI